MEQDMASRNINAATVNVMQPYNTVYTVSILTNLSAMLGLEISTYLKWMKDGDTRKLSRITMSKKRNNN